MAVAAKRPCAKAGCRDLVESGYCPAHRDNAAGRGNSSERGYDWTWRRFRLWFLSQAENAVCADCIEMNCLPYQFATEVHHIKKLAAHPELRLEPSNCKGLCARHHAIRTARGE